jgi:hypothetical protein
MQTSANRSTIPSRSDPGIKPGVSTPGNNGCTKNFPSRKAAQSPWRPISARGYDDPMQPNPYESPHELNQLPNADDFLRRQQARVLAWTIAMPFVVVAVYCFCTAYSYVGATDPVDNPYVSSFLRAGAFFLTVACATLFLTLFVRNQHESTTLPPTHAAKSERPTTSWPNHYSF